MSYLDKYGKRSQRFQEGGPMPAGAEMAPPQQAGPAPAEGQEEQILQLAEAAVAGDQQAAAELGMMLAPMILQQVDAEMQGAEGAEAAPAAPEPVFRRGGKFVGAIK